MFSDESVDHRLGPQPVVLDHTSGFEGLLFVDDDLLGVGLIRTSLINPNGSCHTMFLM